LTLPIAAIGDDTSTRRPTAIRTADSWQAVRLTGTGPGIASSGRRRSVCDHSTHHTSGSLASAAMFWCDPGARNCGWPRCRVNSTNPCVSHPARAPTAAGNLNANDRSGVPTNCTWVETRVEIRSSAPTFAYRQSAICTTAWNSGTTDNRPEAESLSATVQCAGPAAGDVRVIILPCDDPPYWAGAALPSGSAGVRPRKFGPRQSARPPVQNYDVSAQDYCGLISRGPSMHRQMPNTCRRRR